MSDELELARSTAAHIEAMRTGRHVLSGFGLREVRSSRDELVIELPIDETVSGAAGALHGGLLATLADYVGGRLASTTVDDGELVVTSDLGIHYLAPIKTTAHAVGTVLKRGRRSVVIRVEVFDGEGGRLAAVCTLQYSTIRPRLTKETT